MDAFSQLVNHVRSQLYRVAYKMMNDKEGAEDVVQDVLAKGWCKKEEIQQLDNPTNWMIRMTKNQAIDRLRSDKARRKRESEVMNVPQVSENPYLLTENSDMSRRLDEWIKQLPAMQGRVLLLRERNGMNYKQIARITNLNENQVRVYLHRARNSLRMKLTQEFK